ncbi:Rho GTPase activating protein [Dispira simplex]|nr:Rho GTPase activating protein [Dispira simplex]
MTGTHGLVSELPMGPPNSEEEVQRPWVQQLILERNTLKAQNEQLWKIVEKQRLIIQQLQKVSNRKTFSRRGSQASVADNVKDSASVTSAPINHASTTLQSVREEQPVTSLFRDKQMPDRTPLVDMTNQNAVARSSYSDFSSGSHHTLPSSTSKLQHEASPSIAPKPPTRRRPALKQHGRQGSNSDLPSFASPDGQNNNLSHSNQNLSHISKVNYCDNTMGSLDGTDAKYTPLRSSQESLDPNGAFDSSSTCPMETSNNVPSDNTNSRTKENDFEPPSNIGAYNALDRDDSYGVALVPESNPASSDIPRTRGRGGSFSANRNRAPPGQLHDEALFSTNATPHGGSTIVTNRPAKEIGQVSKQGVDNDEIDEEEESDTEVYQWNDVKRASRISPTEGQWSPYQSRFIPTEPSPNFEDTLAGNIRVIRDSSGGKLSSDEEVTTDNSKFEKRRPSLEVAVPPAVGTAPLNDTDEFHQTKGSEHLSHPGGSEFQVTPTAAQPSNLSSSTFERSLLSPRAHYPSAEAYHNTDRDGFVAGNTSTPLPSPFLNKVFQNVGDRSLSGITNQTRSVTNGRSLSPIHGRSSVIHSEILPLMSPATLEPPTPTLENEPNSEPSQGITTGLPTTNSAPASPEKSRFTRHALGNDSYQGGHPALNRKQSQLSMGKRISMRGIDGGDAGVSFADDSFLSAWEYFDTYHPSQTSMQTDVGSGWTSNQMAVTNSNPSCTGRNADKPLSPSDVSLLSTSSDPSRRVADILANQESNTSSQELHSELDNPLFDPSSPLNRDLDLSSEFRLDATGGSVSQTSADGQKNACMSPETSTFGSQGGVLDTTFGFVGQSGSDSGSSGLKSQSARTRVQDAPSNKNSNLSPNYYGRPPPRESVSNYYHDYRAGAQSPPRQRDSPQMSSPVKPLPTRALPLLRETSPPTQVRLASPPPMPNGAQLPLSGSTTPAQSVESELGLRYVGPTPIQSASLLSLPLQSSQPPAPPSIKEEPSTGQWAVQGSTRPQGNQPLLEVPPLLSLQGIIVKMNNTVVKPTGKGKEVLCFNLSVRRYNGDPAVLSGMGSGPFSSSMANLSRGTTLPEEESVYLWTVEKQYPDFLQLDTQIRQIERRSPRRDIKSYRLPDKGLINSLVPSKSDLRKRSLDQYLSYALMISLFEPEFLCEFLSVNIVESPQHHNSLGYKAGYLTKRGKNFGGWKRRFYHVSPERPFLDYSDVMGGPRIGEIYLVGSSIARQKALENGKNSDLKYRHAFMIVERKRGGKQVAHHVFCAETDAEREDWINTLCFHIKGNQDGGVVASPSQLTAPGTHTPPPVPIKSASYVTLPRDPSLESGQFPQGGPPPGTLLRGPLSVSNLKGSQPLPSKTSLDSVLRTARSGSVDSQADPVGSGTPPLATLSPLSQYPPLTLPNMPVGSNLHHELNNSYSHYERKLPALPPSTGQTEADPVSVPVPSSPSGKLPNPGLVVNTNLNRIPKGGPLSAFQNQHSADSNPSNLSSIGLSSPVTPNQPAGPPGSGNTIGYSLGPNGGSWPRTRQGSLAHSTTESIPTPTSASTGLAAKLPLQNDTVNDHGTINSQGGSTLTPLIPPRKDSVSSIMSATAKVGNSPSSNPLDNRSLQEILRDDFIPDLPDNTPTVTDDNLGRPKTAGGDGEGSSDGSKRGKKQGLMTVNWNRARKIFTSHPNGVGGSGPTSQGGNSVSSSNGSSNFGGDTGKLKTWGPVFGIPLDQAVMTSRVKESYSLPAIVYRSIEYLDAKDAASEEGIYRLSGSSQTIKVLRQKFDTDGDFNILKSNQYQDVHAVAGLLKLYLRELPTSVLTPELHPQFMKIIDYNDRRSRVKELGRLVSILPLPNYTLLRALTAHLIRIVRKAEINKMTLRNVGIVFSPSLGIPAGVFNLLILEFKYVFWVNDEGVPEPRPISQMMVFPADPVEGEGSPTELESILSTGETGATGQLSGSMLGSKLRHEILVGNRRALPALPGQGESRNSSLATIQPLSGLQQAVVVEQAYPSTGELASPGTGDSQDGSSQELSTSGPLYQTFGPTPDLNPHRSHLSPSKLSSPSRGSPSSPRVLGPREFKTGMDSLRSPDSYLDTLSEDHSPQHFQQDSTIDFEQFRQRHSEQRKTLMVMRDQYGRTNRNSLLYAGTAPPAMIAKEREFLENFPALAHQLEDHLDLSGIPSFYETSMTMHQQSNRID